MAVWRPRSRTVFTVMAIWAVAGVFACGSGQKPPVVAEVPINEGTPSANDDPSNNDTPPVTNVDTGGRSGTGPQPLETTVDAGGDTTPKKGPLGESECKKVIKKLADFIQRENHQPPIAQADLDNNPVFNPMLGQCQQETTKKQYTCAMSAKNKAAWETCMK